MVRTPPEPIPPVPASPLAGPMVRVDGTRWLVSQPAVVGSRYEMTQIDEVRHARTPSALFGKSGVTATLSNRFNAEKKKSHWATALYL